MFTFIFIVFVIQSPVCSEWMFCFVEMDLMLLALKISSFFLRFSFDGHVSLVNHFTKFTTFFPCSFRLFVCRHIDMHSSISVVILNLTRVLCFLFSSFAALFIFTFFSRFISFLWFCGCIYRYISLCSSIDRRCSYFNMYLFSMIMV